MKNRFFLRVCRLTLVGPALRSAWQGYRWGFKPKAGFRVHRPASCSGRTNQGAPGASASAVSWDDITAYQEQRLEGWRVLVNQKLLADRALCSSTLALLGRQLQQITRAVPEDRWLNCARCPSGSSTQAASSLACAQRQRVLLPSLYKPMIDLCCLDFAGMCADYSILLLRSTVRLSSAVIQLHRLTARIQVVDCFHSPPVIGKNVIAHQVKQEDGIGWARTPPGELVRSKELA